MRRACSAGCVVLGTATDCTLSLTTAWVRIPAWACEKVASDLRSGGGFFDGYSGFLHYLQLASHELATIGINVTKNKIPNSKSNYEVT